MAGPDFSPEALERGIKACNANIAIFEKAIEKERQTIREYRLMAEQLAHKKHVMAVAGQGISVEVVRDAG